MSSATATATAVRPFAISLEFVSTFFRLFARARRFEQLFEMSDAELARRGLSRDALVRSYISGIALN